MNSNGISFIARKVAAQSGDVRLAMEICRRILLQRLAEPNNHNDEDSGPIPLTDVVKAIKSVLDSKSKSSISSLPRNLQMILFASTRLINVHASSPSQNSIESTASHHTLYEVDDLYDCYMDASRDAGVFKPLSRNEFKVALETLSSEGLISSMELRKQQIKLQCTTSDLLQSFKNDPYFSRLI
ncbi:hypothetical protein PINS_up005607 [Pythium insidiosum]|nr:hypothetical protein PINS_up005607 [Pythium insidiosum]